jgi:hypothetical protein
MGFSVNKQVDVSGDILTVREAANISEYNHQVIKRMTSDPI